MRSLLRPESNKLLEIGHKHSNHLFKHARPTHRSILPSVLFSRLVLKIFVTPFAFVKRTKRHDLTTPYTPYESPFACYILPAIFSYLHLARCGWNGIWSPTISTMIPMRVGWQNRYFISLVLGLASCFAFCYVTLIYVVQSLTHAHHEFFSYVICLEGGTLGMRNIPDVSDLSGRWYLVG